jgi:regulator of sirC expression with transglutaminase-like and TPR domain
VKSNPCKHPSLFSSVQILLNLTNNLTHARPTHNRNEEALVDFARAIELDPSNASSYNSRGLVHDKLVSAAWFSQHSAFSGAR